ncbi:fibrillin-2-like, partial [Penaeus monodon]|uniref:fibrillin-2-like n=1 Tax=Penaeus monodon TaxID=6687 RepID=UPI0018A70786
IFMSFDMILICVRTVNVTMLLAHLRAVNGESINVDGTYDCRCRDGFTGNGKTCRDVNECLTNNGGCDRDAQCINTDGSFKCVCDAGFLGDGFFCEDIDECTQDPTLCENGQCLNYPGSFQCDCEMGFMHPDQHTKQSCVDIDECDMFSNLLYIDECDNPDICQFGTCVNQQGTHVCECPPNYELISTGDGLGLIDVGGECYLEVVNVEVVGVYAVNP